MRTPLKGDKQVNAPQSPEPIEPSLSSKRDQQTSSPQLKDPTDANLSLKTEQQTHLPQVAESDDADSGQSGSMGDSVIVDASPEDDQQKDLAKTSTTAVRVFQALLLLAGLGWAIAWAHWPMGFDDMQGPGF